MSITGSLLLTPACMDAHIRADTHVDSQMQTETSLALRACMHKCRNVTWAKFEIQKRK